MSEYERTAMETANEYERRLITLAKQGDPRALAWLFSANGPIYWLRRACAKRLWDFPDHVDDVVANTHRRILENLGKAPDDSALISIWAGRILRYIIFEFWKEIGKDRKNLEYSAPEDEDGEEPVDSFVNIADPDSMRPSGLTDEEAHRYFVQLSDGLESIIHAHFDTKRQEFLWLFLQDAIDPEPEGLAAIAKQTGLTYQSAKRAREALAKLLKSDGLD